MDRTVTLMVNPRSGHGRAARAVPKVLSRLRSGMPGANVRVIRTTSYESARAQAFHTVAESVLARRTEDVLIMMGGDGMASLGLNACADTDVTLGIIPAGTGDDFARGIGVPRSIRGAVEAIVRGHRRTIDLTLAQGLMADGADRRYVGSVVSSGYDARVNARVNNSRVNLGTFSYGAAVLTEIAGLRPIDYRLVIDGEEIRTQALLVAVGNSGWVGGGIHLCPFADPADGMLDITLIDPVTRPTLVKLFPRLFSGDFISHPAVHHRRAREVLLDGRGLVPMADGEDLGPAPLQLSVQPGCLRVFVAESR